MSNEYIERDCTITHEGHTFTANGALVNDAYLIAYPSDKRTGYMRHTSKYRATFEYRLLDWHGNMIGTWWEISNRPAVFFNVRSPMSSTYHYMRARLTDGREYSLRGFGVGMVARGKRIKSK